MATRYGTAHFNGRQAAFRYYRPYGYSTADVQAKMERGEIHLRPPVAKPGQKVILCWREGRYFIEETGA